MFNITLKCQNKNTCKFFIDFTTIWHGFRSFRCIFTPMASIIDSSFVETISWKNRIYKHLILKNKHYNAHHQLVRWWYWLHEIPQTFWNAGATWLALDNTSIIWTIYGLIFKTTNTWSKLIFKTNVFLGMFGLLKKKLIEWPFNHFPLDLEQKYTLRIKHWANVWYFFSKIW
jgi:hypothetical protein